MSLSFNIIFEDQVKAFRLFIRIRPTQNNLSAFCYFLNKKNAVLYFKLVLIHSCSSMPFVLMIFKNDIKI